MSESPTPSTCPTCGAVLPTGTALDACPRCLLAAGLGDSEPPSAASGSDAPTPEEVGTWFPLLEILELVGQGGMGVVYKARQISLDRVVALKVLPASISDDPAFASRFTREAKTMARLDHPNIVRVHEFGETEGRYYLVMEYVDGSNLRQVMEAGGLAPREALAIVPQVCEALQYAHDRGVVHRDIKPENVLMDRRGLVKLTDFGLAKLVQQDPHDMTLTAAGQVMGTPRYMAPEQYKSPQDVDHRADIYSLGVVFYEMLTGDVPMGRFDPPSEKVEVDIRLDDVVLRTLEKERERRYQRVDDVKTEVASITGTPSPPVEAPVKAGPRRRAVEPVAAVPSEEPRWSKLAVAGFLCMPGVFLAPVLAVLVGRLFGRTEIAIALAMGIALLTLVTGFFVSLAGWITTARSRGALKGQGLAIAGTILSVPLFLLLLVAVAATFLMVGVDEPPASPSAEFGYPDAWADSGDVQPSESPVPPVPTPPLPERPTDAHAAAGPGPILIGVPEHAQDEIVPTLLQIETLWGELQRLTKGDAPVTPDELGALIARIDRERILRMRPRDLPRLKEKGVLGLVLPPSSIDVSRLGDYRLAQIDFSPLEREQPYATVTARAGEQSLTFDLVWNGSEIHYAVAPVRHSSDTSYDKPELVRRAPEAWSRNQTRNLQTHVEILWSVYRALWELGDVPLQARVPDGILPSLLPAHLSGSWKGEAAKKLVEKGRYGENGLLFLDATILPVPLDQYELESIAVDDPRRKGTPLGEGKHATVVAASGEPANATLSFPVVWAEGRWWFDLSPATR